VGRRAGLAGGAGLVGAGLVLLGGGGLAAPPPALAAKQGRRRLREEDFTSASAPFEFRGKGHEGVRYVDTSEGGGRDAREGDLLTLHFETRIGPVIVVSTRQARMLGENRSIPEPLQLRCGAVPPEVARPPRVDKVTGVGVTVQPNELGDLYVTRVARYSPAYQAGIGQGDQILSIAGRPAAELSTADVAELLPGEANTEVELVTRMPESDDSKAFTLTREEYEVPRAEPNAASQTSGGLYSGQDAPKPPFALYFKESFAGMRQGGTRTLLLPPDIGYGANGYREIPPGRNFMVDVELLDVTRA